MIQKYTFSGHESFPCKTLWLKKGYDFVIQGRDFNRPRKAQSNEDFSFMLIDLDLCQYLIRN